MPIDIEIESFPNSERPLDPQEKEREELRAIADAIAKLLDSAFVLPGTSIRIGLDPLLGLIPGIGDVISNLIGSSLLFLATRLGVPRIVIFRMALNIFINMALGIIPGIGDIFSFWFKSNIRNSHLLRRYCQAQPPSSTMADWIYVLLLIAGMLAVLLGMVMTLLWIIAKLWQMVM
jgi:hypothetical protein